MSTPAPVPPRPRLRRTVLAAGIGNLVEQYDFGVYGYLAPILSPLFFPEFSRLAGLLSTYGIYAVSFLMKPLGGVLFGGMGDRLGRRAALTATVALIGLFTGLIGLLPDYRHAGALAPVLLLVLRMLQGVAAGGEYSGAVDFIVEHGPPRRRGLFASFASIGVYLGLLCGAGAGALITATMSDAALASWGWRVPFLVALPLAALGLVLRLGVDETPEFRRAAAAGHAEPAPLRATLRTQWRPILLYIGLTVGGSVSSYSVITFLPQYLINDVGLGKDASLLTSVIAMAVLLPALPVTGWLVDRVGRKPVHLVAGGLYLVLPAIAYSWASTDTFGGALGAQLLFMVPVALNSAVVTVLIPELFPTRVRATAGGIAFNVSYGLFGGTGPLVATYLVGVTGTVMSVALYASGAAAITLIVSAVFFRETRDVDLAAERPAGPMTETRPTPA